VRKLRSIGVQIARFDVDIYMLCKLRYVVCEIGGFGSEEFAVPACQKLQKQDPDNINPTARMVRSNPLTVFPGRCPTPRFKKRRILISPEVDHVNGKCAHIASPNRNAFVSLSPWAVKRFSGWLCVCAHTGGIATPLCDVMMKSKPPSSPSRFSPSSLGSGRWPIAFPNHLGRPW